ncbi:MAG: Uma2 family endonuclease [Acidobacteria bacterium]|nr:Uma2 family endonuclease [Acidobacteriota bacterium]
MQAVMEKELILDPEKSYEIVNGQPEEKERPGARHGMIAARLLSRLNSFVEAHQLGVAFTEVNFKIGQNERIPNLSFVAADRIPVEGVPEGVWQIPPDLAVEIISPNDLHDKVSHKVLEYLEAGVKQVWLVSSETRTVTIFRAMDQVQVIAGERNLESPDLLPGFSCALTEIFPAAVQA